MVGAASISWPTGCRPTLVHSRPVDIRSTAPHSQIAVASRPVRRASQRARSRDEQLQHRWRAIFERGLGNKRLGRVVTGTADRDRPLLLQACDEFREVGQPSGGAEGQRLVTHDGGDVSH
jgi:hypothetical protein